MATRTYFYIESFTRVTTTSNTYVDVLSFNPTEVDTTTDHLQFFSCNEGTQSTSVQGYVRLTKNDAVTHIANRENASASATYDQLCAGGIYKATTLTQGNAYAVAHRVGTSGVTTVSSDTAIAIVQMTATVVPPPLIADFVFTFEKHGRRRL